MKRIGIILLVTIAGFGLGCDDGNGDSGGTGGGSSDTCGGTIKCVAAGGSGGESGAVCVNDGDCGLIESGDAKAAGKSCVLKAACSSGTDAENLECASNCLQDEKLSPQCADCYATSALCSVDNCLEECVADADSCDCVTCQIDAGCREQFFECSGLADPGVSLPD